MNEYIERAEEFLIRCVHNGLAHSWDVEKETYVKAYPEVTGYVLKYFCDYKDALPDNLLQAADYLVDIQDETGGYCSFSRKNILYGFDTAQIMRGLCAAYSRTKDEKYLAAAEKAGRFLIASQEGNGAFKPIYNTNIGAWVIRDETYSIWNGPFSGLMCKLTESLYDLYMVTHKEEYRTALERAADFYEQAEYIEYSHPLGYWLEGLLAAKREGTVIDTIKSKILSRIADNGYIAYKNDLPYAYVSGTMQLGIILFQMGYMEEAERIRDYGRLVQSKNGTGGLFQYADSNGHQDVSVHAEINSWGTKYFCELERLLLK